MPKKSNTFSDFQSLGQHYGRSPAPDRNKKDDHFSKEEGSLRAQLLKAQNEHNKKFEIINLSKLGLLCRKRERYEEALKYYQQAFQLAPEDAFVLDGLGAVYFQMGNYDQAIEWFNKKLKEYPKDKKAMDGLSITYREKGEYDLAIKWFKKRLKAERNYKKAMDGLGITYREKGEYDLAIKWFKKRLKAEPDDKQAMDGLGITYREKGEYEQAVFWFEKLLNHDPNDQYAWRGLASTYQAMGKTPQTLKLLKRRLHTDPNDAPARARLMEISKQHEAAQEWQEAKDLVDFLNDTPASIPRAAPVTTKPAETLAERAERLQKQIERRQAKLLHSQQIAGLGMMASGLTHEIRQPLQIILAAAQNCQRDIQRNAIDFQTVLEDLANIAKSSKRIDHIVTRLHVLSGERKPKLEALSMNKVIEDSLIMFREQLKTRGIRVEKDLADGLPPLKADKVQLEQVFINLIHNARDALESCERKQIRVSTRANDHTVQVRFADTGAGIKEEERIFEAFFTTKDKGVGLGLHIARETIQEYGGTIRVDSTVNTGAAFLIVLPVFREKQ